MPSIRVRLLLVGIACAWGLVAGAAEPGEGPGSGAAAACGAEATTVCPALPNRDFAESLERNYFFYEVPNVRPAGESPLVFEAHMAPHFFPWNFQYEVERAQHSPDVPTSMLGTVAGKLRLHRLFGPGVLLPPGVGGALWVDTFSVTPQIRLRMVGDDSTPVRPPSFMPRFDYQLFGFWKPSPGRVNALELRLTPFGHHSNGQQYCLFDKTLIAKDGACPPVDVASPPLASLNRWSGNFSTNYLAAGARFTLLRLDAREMERNRAGLGVSFEYDPVNGLPGAIDRETAALYGKKRLEVQGQLSCPWGGLWRLDAAYMWIWSTPSAIPDWRARVELAWRFKNLGGLGLFARWAGGQDYLNALFARPEMKELQFGLVWDTFPAPSYSFEAPKG